MGEIVQTEGKETVRKRAKNIPKSLIPTLQAEYLSGTKSIREIAIKYNLPVRALEVRCSRDHWRVKENQIVEKIVKNIEKKDNLRLDRLHSHEERMIERMEKRLVSVDQTIDQTGGLIEPSDLRSIVSTEQTIDAVIRRSLGAEEKSDTSSMGKSLEEAIVSVLHKVRNALAADSSRVIEVEPLKLAADKFRE